MVVGGGRTLATGPHQGGHPWGTNLAEGVVHLGIHASVSCLRLC